MTLGCYWEDKLDKYQLPQIIQQTFLNHLLSARTFTGITSLNPHIGETYLPMTIFNAEKLVQREIKWLAQGDSGRIRIWRQSLRSQCLCYTAAYFLKTPLDSDKLAEVVDRRIQRFPQEGLGKSSKHCWILCFTKGYRYDPRIFLRSVCLAVLRKKSLTLLGPKCIVRRHSF